MKQLSIIILTLNEEKNLPACLESLKDMDAEIFIVDSGSTDKTVETARAAGCFIVHQDFENHATQMNRALETLPLKTPWVMRLDADERLTPELVSELKQKISRPEPDISGYLVKRRVYFWGRWIRFGGMYPVWLLRVWRNGYAVCETRNMDEHMILASGQATALRHDIIDDNRKGLSFWTAKHNSYADREVLDLLKVPDRGEKLSSGQARLKRWIRLNLYARTPLFLRAFLYWIFRYFLLFGFLDGRPGLVFHFLQGFWYRLLVDAKLYEYRQQTRQEKQ